MLENIFQKIVKKLLTITLNERIIKTQGKGNGPKERRNEMRHYPRHRATSPVYIMKDTYEEILAYAKRKYAGLCSSFAFEGEFFLFKTEYQGSTSYSAENTDFFGKSFEHWVKVKGGRWEKV